MDADELDELLGAALRIDVTSDSSCLYVRVIGQGHSLYDGSVAAPADAETAEVVSKVRSELEWREIEPARAKRCLGIDPVPGLEARIADHVADLVQAELSLVFVDDEIGEL